MEFRLSISNVEEYLLRSKLCTPAEMVGHSIKLVSAKNFNLLIDMPASERALFVKQERFSKIDMYRDMQREWDFQNSLSDLPELKFLYGLIPEILLFDKENSIVVHNYLKDYQDLMEFHEKENVFPTDIASNVGTTLAKIHRLTFDNNKYKDKLENGQPSLTRSQIVDFVKSLSEVDPDIFGKIPDDAIKFFALYQRYENLHTSLQKLSLSYKGYCLVHNDLKLNNLLVCNSWQDECLIRILDWEGAAWGDPACDLGAMVSSYLQSWLDSIVTSQHLSIEQSLELAIVPLEVVQPSISVLLESYLQEFPDILLLYPNFILRTIEFSGLAMIQQIQSMIQYQKTFGNTGIVMLQVAKSLVCSPLKSAAEVFNSEALNKAFI